MASSDAQDEGTNQRRLLEILARAKLLAKEYREVTGRPLGVTGEIGEYEAARLLGLELADVRQEGYDALWTTTAGVKRVQIKARVILDGAGPGQRMGSIRLEKEWDCVILVLLNAAFEAVEMYCADRPVVERALMTPGSRARNERGALGVSKFKSIGRLVWPESMTRA